MQEAIRGTEEGTEGVRQLPQPQKDFLAPFRTDWELVA